MLLTWEAVATAGAGSATAAGAVAGAMAAAALPAAHGNSGAILAGFLRGLAERWEPLDRIAAPEVRRGLAAAAASATAAVSRPVEGTILSVADAAAHGARTTEGDDVSTVLAGALAAAEQALARTPEQLTVLRDAGVVDAAGHGLVVLLTALASGVSGERADAAPPAFIAERSVTPGREAGSAREAGSEGFGYEVQYLLDAPDEVVPQLRAVLAELGDSLVVAGGGGVHNVHVHVNDIGAAVEAGIEVGRPHRIRVTRFADATASDLSGERVAALVVVSPCRGVDEVFRSAGAHVVAGGLGRDCPTEDLVAAMRATGAGRVVLLPNDRDLLSRAQAAADVVRAEGVTVAVLPTRSVVQGMAALAVHDGDRRFGDDVVTMSAAAAATRYAAVTRATRDAQTSAGRCRAGDVLGMIDDDVVVIGDDVAEVARGLLDRLLVGGGELVTLVTGVDAPPDLSEGLAGYLAVTRPVIETVVHHGGQAYVPLLVGVE
jgi:DAK2 domain fusion protein YloV